MPERNCQLNTGLESCGGREPVCPIPRKFVEYYSQYRYYSFTDISLRDLNTGELEPPKLITVDHKSNPVWDLWDVPLEEIQRNRAQVEARKLIQLQVKKKPQVIIQFPPWTPKKVETRVPLLSKRA